MYDRVNHTFEYPDDDYFYVNKVRLLNFEDIPTCFQRYIIYKASGRAAVQLVSNAQLQQMLATYEAKFQLTDGSTNVTVFDLDGRNVGFNQAFMIPFDFIVFIATGESLLASSTTANAVLTGSFRQLADINGNLVNPSGFTAQ